MELLKQKLRTPSWMEIELRGLVILLEDVGCKFESFLKKMKELSLDLLYLGYRKSL